MLSLEDRIRGYEPFFGKWQLKSYMPLGEGTSGVVYPIRSGEYEAALKVIPIPKNEKALQGMMNRLKDEAAVREELERELGYVKAEIETMRLLEGESNIVYFTDSSIIRRSDTYGWDVLICMEKLVRIDYFLKDPKIFGYTFNMDLILHIWSEMIAGLCVCERNNIVHFDIKPENIFYAPIKNHFKLGDFGVAVNTRGRMNVMQGGFVGTQDYAAPEMWHREGGDSRSDIYSLAMVIYQLLNGYRIPFLPVGTAVTHDDFVRAFNTRVEKKSAIPPIKGVRPEIMRILLRCLEYEPDNRYPSFEALRHDLMQVIYGGGSVQPSAAGRKQRSIVVPIIAVAASLGVAGAMVAIGMNSMNKKEEAAPVAILENPETQTEEAVETDLIETIESPEPEVVEEAEEAPVDASFSVNSSFRHYLDDDQRLLSVLNARIEGDVRVEARLNGEEIPAERTGNVAAADLPGNWEINDGNWPEDGVFLITTPEIRANQSLSIDCYAPDGEALYSETIDFHLDEFKGRTAFIAGNYVAPLRDVEITGYNFESVNGAVRPGQSYEFFGKAEPEAVVKIYLNSVDRYVDSVACNEAGEWGYPLNESLLNDGESFRLLVAYDGAEAAFSEEFIYDASVSMLELATPILADSTLLSGNTEPGTRIRLNINGAGVAAVTADENGHFEMRVPEGSLHEDSSYELLATDAVGNEDRLVGNVGKRSKYAPIEIHSPASGVYGRETEIHLTGRAQPGESVWVISDEINYREPVETDQNGDFNAVIALPEALPDRISLKVQYEDAEDGYNACSLDFDFECELNIPHALSVGRTDLIIESEPGSGGVARVISAQGAELAAFDFVCDENGACLVDISAALPLEDDRVVVTITDSMGNTSETEVLIETNPDLRPFSRISGSGEPIDQAIINADAFDANGMRFIYEGYPGAEVELIVRRNGEEYYRCRMNDEDGVFTADISDIGFADGDYSFALAYAARPDREYTVDCRLMLARPEITEISELSEGGRTVQGFTAPSSLVRIIQADTLSEIGSSYASEDGSFTIALKQPVEPGEYVLEAADEYGNTAYHTLHVAARTELTLRMRDGDAAVINAATETLALYGVADPNEEIVLTVNGGEYARFHSDESGWRYDLNAADMPEGAFELGVAYASGEGGVAVLHCEKDTACVLEVDTFNESAWFITGFTDLDAHVELIRDGEAVAEGSIMPDGQFSVNLTGAVQLPLDVNQQFTLRATDAFGNVAEHTVSAEAIEREQITLKMKPQPNKQGYLNGSTIRLSGRAERNTSVVAQLLAGDNVWTYEASAKHGKYDVSIQIPSEIRDGELVARVSYADGFAASSSAEVRFMLDRDVPVVHMDSAGMIAGIRDITGSCDENCAVRLIVNGEIRSEMMPYEDGRLVFRDIELSEGDDVHLEAEDGAGNKSVSERMLVARMDERVGGVVYTNSESFNVGDSVRLEGWFAINSARYVSLQFRSDGNLVHEEILTAADMRKMVDDELEYAISEHGLQLDARSGYWFSKDIVLNRAMAAGDLEVALCIVSDSVATVCHDTAIHFTVNKPELDARVSSSRVGGNYAFGLDDNLYGKEFPSDNILLNGWIFRENNDMGQIGGIRIESLDGSVAPVDLVFGSVNTIDGIAYEEGVYSCSRDAAKAFPDAPEYGLGGVNASDVGAGFMVVLHQNLPDGDYRVILETNFEGGYEFTVDTVITINNSLHSDIVAEARAVLDGWTNEMVSR